MNQVAAHDDSVQALSQITWLIDGDHSGYCTSKAPYCRGSDDARGEPDWWVEGEQELVGRLFCSASRASMKLSEILNLQLIISPKPSSSSTSVLKMPATAHYLHHAMQTELSVWDQVIEDASPLVPTGISPSPPTTTTPTGQFGAVSMAPGTLH